MQRINSSEVKAFEHAPKARRSRTLPAAATILARDSTFSQPSGTRLDLQGEDNRQPSYNRHSALSTQRLSGRRFQEVGAVFVGGGEVPIGNCSDPGSTIQDTTDAE
jgi:hypothetical protein